MRILFAILLCVSSVTSLFGASGWPSGRGLPNNDWSMVGINDGAGRRIVTTVSTTLGTGSSAATINSALAAAASNSVVLLDAGTFSLGGGQIDIGKNGVVLRGATNSAGQPTTILSDCIIKITKTAWPSAGSWADITGQNITAGLTEGSTSITLSASASSEFAVGNLFAIDQTFDGTTVKDSSVEFAHRPNRSLVQIVLCTNKSGSTLGFTPPLVTDYWNSGQDPEAWGWSATYGDTLHQAGLECVDIPQAGSGTQVITMGPAYNSWIYNVRGTDWPTSGGASFVRIAYSAACEITDSTFHDQTTVANSSYAIYPTVVTYCAFERNIFTNLALAMPCVSALGCSFSYSYATGPYAYDPDTWLPEYFFPHGGHSADNLYEGNWLEGSIYFDAIFSGNNSRCGFIRNRIKGWASGKTGNTTPIVLEVDMDKITILANVFGEDGYHTTYGSIYSIDASCQSIIKTNNYNVANDGVNSAETLTSDTISDSYRHPAGKPAWAKSCQWPFYPVVSTTTNAWYYTNSIAGFYSFFRSNSPPADVASGATYHHLGGASGRLGR